MTRMHYSVAAFVFIFSTGCVTSDPMTMGSGGVPLETGGDDTAQPAGGPDDTGMVGGGGSPPVLESVEAEWKEDTNYEWYILSSLIYTDAEDDVRDGGMVGVTIVVDGDTFTEEWFAIDGQNAVHDEDSNTVQISPRPPDVQDPTGATVELTIRIKDTQNNTSNEITVSPEDPA